MAAFPVSEKSCIRLYVVDVYDPLNYLKEQTQIWATSPEDAAKKAKRNYNNVNVHVIGYIAEGTALKE